MSAKKRRFYRNTCSMSLILGFLFSFCACQNAPINEQKEEQGGGEEEQKEYIPNPNILFTEVNTGTRFSDRAIEISNISNEDISLKDYAFNMYRGNNNVPTETIKLDDYTIKASSSFVIAYSNANQSILDKADLISDLYLNDGTFAAGLTYHEKLFDVVGVIGYMVNYAQGAVLLRLKEYFRQTTEFDLSEWIRNPINTIDSLGNTDVISEETLLNGPKLTDKDFELPFCTEQAKGSGGLIKVSYNRNIDGDTTSFNYGYSYSDFGVSGSNNTRYFAIDTPEIAHSPDEVAEPYGNEARDFTNSQLNKAKHYYVQSVNGYTFRETYGRMLGYVWISFVDNPKSEDFVLLNWLIVKNGFSDPSFISREGEYHSLMTYEGIDYIEYIYFAQQYAIKNKLNIHS